MQALEDVTIADFTQLMAGGWAAQKLGDMGADVIKIEPPGGEYQREMSYCGQYLNGAGIGFLTMNRNKRSVAIDLKTDEGYQIARTIVEDADVLMQNFRPGVMERLGLDYRSVTEFNPEIVYVSVSAYGTTGPYSDRPGQDLLYQARLVWPPTLAGPTIRRPPLELSSSTSTPRRSRRYTRCMRSITGNERTKVKRWKRVCSMERLTCSVTRSLSLQTPEWS